ncbi:MAG: hypothetical protein GXN96_03170 [Aquificae bacterium]|nr:hypothetical protein [Aquificota bacterium]
MKKALVVLFTGGVLFANPWGREEGELFISTQYYHYEATSYWDGSGKRRPIGCTFKKKEVALYGEYGLSAITTLFIRIPYQRLECGNRSTDGLADLEMGLQRKIYRTGPGVLALRFTAIIPSGYSIKDDPRLGYGRVGAEATLLGGYGFNRGWTEGGIGFRYYGGYPSEQVRSYWRVGLKPLDSVLLMNTLELHYGLANGTTKVVGQNITLQPDYKLLQNDLALSLKTGSFWIQIGYLKALWGRNTGDGSSVYAQLWILF